MFRSSRRNRPRNNYINYIIYMSTETDMKTSVRTGWSILSDAKRGQNLEAEAEAEVNF